MGVANSKRIYEEGKDDAPKSGAESGKDEGAASEDKGAPEEKGPEAKEEPAGGIDRTEADKWKPFFKDVLKLSQVKDKIKTLILDEKASKDIYGKKGIIISKNDVTDFTNGEKEYIADLVLFLKDGIPNKKGEPPLKFDKEKAEPLTTGPQADNNGKQIRNLKPDTDFKVLDKDYMDPIISATKLALKHKKFLKVLQEYILKTDTFKKAHKDEFIKDKKEDVKKGDKTVADAVEENDNKKEVSAKEGEGEGEGAAKEGGDGGYDSDGSSNYSGSSSNYSGGGSSSNISFSSDSDDTSSNSSMDAGSITEIASMTAGGSSITESGGGIVPNMLLTNKQIRKNKGKADYKKFKKETRANFDEKTKQFFNDTTALDTFMEDNETDLLALMYYQTGVPLKWIDKSKKDEKKKVADALLKAITEYKPPEPSATEGAPATEGEKKPGEEGAAATPPADGDKDKKPAGEEKTDTPPGAEGGGAELLAAEIEKLSAKIQGLTGASSLTDAVADAMQSQTGGGGSSKKHSKKSKKKRKTNKKGSKKINININLGKKNTISDSDCSSSSDSDSSSSSSSSSSDSSSDSESSSSSSESDSSQREKKKRRRRNKKKSKRKSK